MNKRVAAMMRIISEVMHQVKHADRPCKASNAAIGKALKTLGFTEDEIIEIQKWG